MQDQASGLPLTEGMHVLCRVFLGQTLRLGYPFAPGEQTHAPTSDIGRGVSRLSIRPHIFQVLGMHSHGIQP